MGLFTKKICPICGNETKGFFSDRILNGEKLCFDCIKKIDVEESMLPFQTIDDVKEHLLERELNQIDYNNFKTTTEKIAGYIANNRKILIREDANMKKWYISSTVDKKTPTLFTYDQLIGYELNINGVETKTPGVSGVAIGYYNYGTTGAVIGGKLDEKTETIVNSISVHITLNHKYKKQFVLEFIPNNVPLKTTSKIYKMYVNQATELINYLNTLYKKK